MRRIPYGMWIKLKLMQEKPPGKRRMGICFFGTPEGTRKGRPGAAGEKYAGGIFLAPWESPFQFETHPVWDVDQIGTDAREDSTQKTNGYLLFWYIERDSKGAARRSRGKYAGGIFLARGRVPHPTAPTSSRKKLSPGSIFRQRAVSIQFRIRAYIFSRF